MVQRKFKQVPEIAVQVSKYSYGSVVSHLGFAYELDAPCGHIVVIAPKVVGTEK